MLSSDETTEQRGSTKLSILSVYTSSISLITIKLAFSFCAEKKQITRVTELFYLDNVLEQIIVCFNCP